MGRNRVLSFISTLSGGGYRDFTTPSPPATSNNLASQPNASSAAQRPNQAPPPAHTEPFPDVSVPSIPVQEDHGPSPLADRHSPLSITHGRQRSSSRPLSMIQTYHPPRMDTHDTIPELQPIFTLLNNHANKLYHEGYFVKLDDKNIQGRPNPDRNWTECFAQLVGTVLSLWDAAELDAAGGAGQGAEVLPKFINVTDASIRVVDSIPTRSADEQPLQNILSLSTAGRNSYLLHFKSHHSLIQWTSAIRLAMFEHSTLQEAYTGALIAGKGKSLNNINLIMSRSKFKTEEWVRVRFGAGVPWRRCWCVITPPDEKDIQKLQKDWKKRSPYDRSHMPHPKGDIKFYDTRKEGKKQKKAKPIATVTNAFSAYAIYPQSKALIDASSLIKVEGTVTIHSNPPSTNEGFFFLMPEVPPAVTGFEMMLRFLFPTWDTFGLYGRPTRLVASTLDPRSLMFAMPKHRRYGYLELMDVASLVLADGSVGWTERQWRQRLKELTAKQMAALDESASSGPGSGRASNRSSKRLSFGLGPGASTTSAVTVMGSERQLAARPRVNFAGSSDGESPRTSRSTIAQPHPSSRTDSAPPATERKPMPSALAQATTTAHARNNSDGVFDAKPPFGAPTETYNSTDAGGRVPGGYPDAALPSPVRALASELATAPERVNSDDEAHSGTATPPRDLRDMQQQRFETPEPVTRPPEFHHAPSSRPVMTPYHSAELRRANSRLSNSTLAHIVNAGGVTKDGMPATHSNGQDGRPVSQGSNQAVGSVAYIPPASASAPSLVGQSTAPLHPGLVPSNNGPPHLPPYSKSPLNRAHQAFAPGPELAPAPLSQPVDGPLQRAGPVPTGPLPQVPPHTGHPPPSHIPGVDNGRQILLVQGPPPPASPAQALSASSSSPFPPQAQPQRMQTPPPHVNNQAPGTGPRLSIQTSPPIHRKPVPSRADSVQRYKESSEPQSAISSTGSLQGYYIDEAALAQVQSLDDNTRSNHSNVTTKEPARWDVARKDTKLSEASSHYDDASSTASPDYASAHESINTRESAERPRAGVLRTVGDPVSASPAKDDFDIPEVNFGPTYNYASAKAPRSNVPPPLVGADASTSNRGTSPLPSPNSLGGSSRPSKPQKLRESHYREDSNDTVRRRSFAWRPGSAMSTSPAAVVGGDNRLGALTPEQFVLHHAQASSTPTLVHRRVPSNNSLLAMRENASSPSMRRTSSYDMLNSAPGHYYEHQRRPSSQGATTTLGMHGLNGSSDLVGSHLSAREQEHLARMTGRPLISVSANAHNNQQVAGGPGLVGAIVARQREKQQMKEGLSSQAVQYATNQRQHQQYQEQQYQEQQYQQQLYQQQLYQQQQYQQQQYQWQQFQQPQTQRQYYMQQQPYQQQQQQYGQVYGPPSPPVQGGYQLPPGHGPPQPRPSMAPNQNAYVPPQGANQQAMGGGWPLMQNPHRQGFPQQGYGGGQPNYVQSQSGGGTAKPRTPGASGQGTVYPGQAF